MLTEHEFNKLQKGQYFNNKYLIKIEFSGSVYKINNKYVVKKLCCSWKAFKKEFETTILLSIYNIAPKVIYHSNYSFSYKKKINLDFMLWKN